MSMATTSIQTSTLTKLPKHNSNSFFSTASKKSLSSRTKTMAAALKVVCALVLCMLVVEPLAATALTCGDVTRQMSGCIKYLQNGGNQPPAACCNGVRALNSQARTTADRQTACRCLQQAAKSMGGSLKANLAEGLPGRCGVNIPYKISTSTNCNNVK